MLTGDDVGHRVVVRRIVAVRGDSQLSTDTLGLLVAHSETHLTVRTDEGDITVALPEVAVARRIPDERARSATERLELICSRGWPAPHTAQLGDWLLRAAGGWSNRGNAALAVGRPDRPIGAAVDAVVDWYAGHDLPPAITVPLPLGRRVTAELDRRGWARSPVSLVQTTRLEPLAAGPAPAGVLLSDRASPQWLAAVIDRKPGSAAAATHILTAVPDACFASVYEDGELAGTARGVLTDGWLGLSSVGVDPRLRRRGLAQRMTRALAQWAVERGAGRAYLQVEADNEAAVALYAGLGFRTSYGYLTRRPGPA